MPIDCIAGTSMGSIVGGAYASGMTIAAMEEIVAEHHRRRRSSTSGRRARTSRSAASVDDRSILLGPEIGLSDELDVTLPKGVVSGVQLETVLRRRRAGAGLRRVRRARRSRSARSRPTSSPARRSSSTDGELPNVMRASMSVPGAIAPAEIAGQLLVDGGLTDNLPVDVARAMGADIVIAVNLGTPLLRARGARRRCSA